MTQHLLSVPNPSSHVVTNWTHHLSSDTLLTGFLLTVEAEGDVDGADVGDRLQVRDAGTLQVRGGGGFAHVYPADGLVSVDEVHGHGLLGGDGMEAGQGATQCSAADVVEVGDQQHGQAVHRLWGGGAAREECERASIKGEEEREGDLLPFLALQERLSGCSR